MMKMMKLVSLLIAATMTSTAAYGKNRAKTTTTWNRNEGGGHSAARLFRHLTVNNISTVHAMLCPSLSCCIGTNRITCNHMLHVLLSHGWLMDQTGGAVRFQSTSIYTHANFPALTSLLHSHSSMVIFHSISFFVAPSFVPRHHGVTSMPKNVRALSNIYGGAGGSSSSKSRNDIKMMPIGVPKVAYRVPGSQSADW